MPKSRPSLKWPQYFIDYLNQSLPDGYRIELDGDDLYIVPTPIKDIYGETPRIQLYGDGPVWMLSDSGSTYKTLREHKTPSELIVLTFNEANKRHNYTIRQNRISMKVSINGLYRDVADLASWCVNAINAADCVMGVREAEGEIDGEE